MFQIINLLFPHMCVCVYTVTCFSISNHKLIKWEIENRGVLSAFVFLKEEQNCQ